MALVEGQADINGLLVGLGTDYDLVQFNVWRRGVRAGQGGPRAWRHGSWSGAEWRSEIIADITLHYGSATTAGWKLLNDAATAAFAPVGDEAIDRELRFVRGNVEYLLFGRPRVFEPDIRPGARRAVADATFVALDPFLYSSVEQSAQMALAIFTGGLAVPAWLSLPVEGIKVGGEAPVINEGTAPTPLRLRIDGPVVEPRVALLRPDGKADALEVNFDLAAGQFLDIDTGAHLALLDGTDNRRGQVSGDFPLLLPGTSTINFSANTPSEQAMLTVTWRHSWW